LRAQYAEDLHMVRYNFPDDDAKSWMASFDRAIAKADEIHPDDYSSRGAILDDALVAVLAVKLLSGLDPAGQSLSKDVGRFFEHVRQVLRRHRRELANVMANLDLDLWRRSADGWYHACMRRSAAQVIADTVDADDDDPLIEPGPLAEVDAEMREIGPELPPLPADVIPRGMPASHWWWFLPAGPPEDDTDY
jgi:hypothetical protein